MCVDTMVIICSLHKIYESGIVWNGGNACLIHVINVLCCRKKFRHNLFLVIKKCIKFLFVKSSNSLNTTSFSHYLSFKYLLWNYVAQQKNMLSEYIFWLFCKTCMSALCWSIDLIFVYRSLKGSKKNTSFLGDFSYWYSFINTYSSCLQLTLTPTCFTLHSFLVSWHLK